MSNNNLPSNIKEIEKFAEKIGIDVKYLLGEKYEGDLFLCSVKSLPANIVFNVGGWLNLYSVKSLPANVVFNVGGGLNLFSVESLPANVVFNVGGGLNLYSVESLPANIVFNVGGWLDLSSVKSLPDNIVFNVGGWLNLYSVESLPANVVFNVGGSLSLYSVKSLPANVIFNVGGYLWMPSVKSLPDNIVFNVGGYLDLSSVKSLPDNVIFNVGGWLNLCSVKSLPNSYSITLGYGYEVKSSLPFKYNNIGENEIQTWQNGKYQQIDGIYCEVIKDRKNIKTCKKVGSNEIFYIVTDGIKYSHGKTIKEAKADLLYKITNRDTSRYTSLKLDSVLTLAEAIECYRVITGSCELGTKMFLTSIKTKKQYKIEEIVKLTENQYGNQTFKQFFNK